MKTQSIVGNNLVLSYRHPLLQNISLYLAPLNVSDPSAIRSVKFTPMLAGMAAVLMALDAHPTLCDRAHQALGALSEESSIGMTYNGLLKALERQESLLPSVKSHLRTHVREAVEGIPTVGGWRLLAIDGSKEELPRTISNEKTFGIADNGRGPQAFITAIVEVHTGLLWDWRIDRARASEKRHLLEMTDDLPMGMLLLADGGFVGFELWSKLNDQKKSFLIRVGANVHLIHSLWPDARIERRKKIVYLWPKDHQKDAPPLRLRLIRIGSKKTRCIC